MPEATEDPRVYFAAERTFLAWIRTGLGLMGIGFAVARFGLFLREFQQSQHSNSPHETGISVTSGVALVALGVAVTVLSTANHIRTVRRLQAGTWTSSISGNAVLLACLLAVVGLAMGFYLLLLR